MRRALVLLLIAALLLPTGALAGKKKKGNKKPKPWTSEEGTIEVAHPVLYSTSGDILSVTVQEFKNSCAIPSSQGVDAYLFEVPVPYQKLEATASAIGSSVGAGGYDLDMFFFDANCEITFVSQASGTDEVTVMPKGTAWIAVANYLADPNTSVHVELEP